MNEEIINKKTFEERVLYSQKLLTKYPDRIPVIIEKNKYDKSNVTIDPTKCKYLIPKHLHISQLIILIRKNIKIDSNKAIFIFIDNLLVPTSSSIETIYNEHKDKDGFLYVSYSCESTFGFGFEFLFNNC
jgi:GABA(A) receptor-associated protein